jgi:uncharacterized protein DUF3301
MNGFELAALVLLGCFGWFWMDTLRARETALAAARRACEGEGLQLLDETVAVERLRPGRDDEGRLALRRDYVFEYSRDGADRHRGALTLLGREVTLLDLRLRPVLSLIRGGEAP